MPDAVQSNGIPRRARSGVVIGQRRQRGRPITKLGSLEGTLTQTGVKRGAASTHRRCSEASSSASLDRYVSRPEKRATSSASNGQPSSRPLASSRKHRNALAVARLERRIVVDEYAVEVRRARSSEHRERLVAKLAVVALVKNESHAAVRMCGRVE